VIKVLINYDNDKYIPVFGFGAKPKLPEYTFEKTQHCFALNGDYFNPNIAGGADGLV